MKKIITEETVKVEMWEAEDGKQFKTEAECEKYENRISLMKRIEAVPHKLVAHSDIFSTGGCCDQLVMFRPRNIGEARALADWCAEYDISNSYSVNGMVGKTLVIREAYTGVEQADLEDIDKDFFYGTLETLDNYIGGFADTIHYYEREMIEENKENAK